METSIAIMKFFLALAIVLAACISLSVVDFHTPRDYTGITEFRALDVYHPYDASFEDRIKRINP